MTDRELMQQALEALELAYAGIDAITVHGKAITALKERLAQPEQEPVAWADMDVRGENKGLSWTPGHFHKTPLYTTPPQRKPLTDEEIGQVLNDPNIAEAHQGHWRVLPFAFARAIEAAHGIKENT